MSGTRRIPVVSYGVEPWPGDRDGWLAYITILHSGQPEDKVPLPEYFRTRDEATKKAKQAATFYLQRLLADT